MLHFCSFKRKSPSWSPWALILGGENRNQSLNTWVVLIFPKHQSQVEYPAHFQTETRAWHIYLLCSVIPSRVWHMQRCDALGGEEVVRVGPLWMVLGSLSSLRGCTLSSAIWGYSCYESEHETSGDPPCSLDLGIPRSVISKTLSTVFLLCHSRWTKTDGQTDRQTHTQHTFFPQGSSKSYDVPWVAIFNSVDGFYSSITLTI